MKALPLSVHRDSVIMMALKVSAWVCGQYVYCKKEAADHKGPIKYGTNKK